MQTILGAGGAIGNELAKALLHYTSKIRLVSRNPTPVNDTDELFKADLSKYEDVAKAVEGSEVVYLTVGLPYSIKIWQDTWPVIMKNVIEACRVSKASLVFFDNIYMYDPANLNQLTEEHPINPSSKKGKVRADIAQMIWDAVKRGEIKAVIARAADFYGPSIKNVSILTETVFKPLSEGKKANWMGSDKFRHSYTHITDAGKATAILGNTPDAFGQVWHLPTAPDPFTGKEWVEIIGKELGVTPKYRVASKFIVRVMGLFMPVMKEMVEMMYQYEQDYIFNSNKFEKRFNYKPIPYLAGVKEIVQKDYKK